MRIGLALVCVAACGGGQSSGAFVTVKGGGIAIDHVSLYLGQAACTKPDGSKCEIAPMGIKRKLAGDNGGVWLRDDSGNAMPFGEQVRAGTAKFQLEAKAGDETLQLVAVGEQNGIAVAYGVANDVTIPAHGAVEVTIALVAASPANEMEESMSPHPDGDFVTEWNMPALCVVAEHWRGGVATRTLVVPNEDPDCDGLRAVDATGQPNPLECDPYYFDFASPFARLSASTCATLGLLNGDHTCLLGGPPCTDGIGPDLTTCAPVGTPVCVPGVLCSSSDCAGPGNMSTLSACAFQNGTGGPGDTFVHCVVYADIQGPCQTSTLTRPTAGHISLGALLAAAPSNRMCTDFQFLRDDSLHNLQTTGNFTAGNAMFQLQDSAVDPCGFDIQWDGSPLPTTIFSQAPVYGGIKVNFDNGNSAVVPLEMTASSCINVPPAQTDAIQCDFIIGSPNALPDTITNCAI